MSKIRQGGEVCETLAAYFCRFTHVTSCFLSLEIKGAALCVGYYGFVFISPTFIYTLFVGIPQEKFSMFYRSTLFPIPPWLCYWRLGRRHSLLLDEIQWANDSNHLHSSLERLWWVWQCSEVRSQNFCIF